MEEKEEWLPVKGYEGLYKVSDWGRVKSLNYRGTGKEKILHQTKSKSGYMTVHLCKDGKPKCCRVHRLVAEVFLPNPDGLPEVNHIDEDKTNNFCCLPTNCNLEWCTHAYNSQYSKNIAVEQLDMDGNVIKRWESTREAERHGYHSSTISYCCQGKRMTHKGYRWRYADQP